MTIRPEKLVLLDTNVVIHLARGNATGQEIERRLHLSAREERPIISSVVRGEVLGLARSWGWGHPRMASLGELLDEFVNVSAGLREVVEDYAVLYEVTSGAGRPIGENDLWIASTARAARADLVTCDTDFDWLHPTYLTRHYVPAQP